MAKNRFKRVPMAAILAKMPGESVVDKCRRLGVSRATYYAWRAGTYRPSIPAATRLSLFTGINVADIRGRQQLTLPP